MSEQKRISIVVNEINVGEIWEEESQWLAKSSITGTMIQNDSKSKTIEDLFEIYKQMKE